MLNKKSHYSIKHANTAAKTAKTTCKHKQPTSEHGFGVILKWLEVVAHTRHCTAKFLRLCIVVLC